MTPQPGDHGEQVDVTGLGALDGGPAAIAMARNEVGERDPPWRRPIGIGRACRMVGSSATAGESDE